MTMAEAPGGAAFRVLRILSGGEVCKRLADMGFTEGAVGTVIRRGFLGGPLQVRLAGYDILIRRSEAACVEVRTEA